MVCINNNSKYKTMCVLLLLKPNHVTRKGDVGMKGLLPGDMGLLTKIMICVLQVRA